MDQHNLALIAELVSDRIRIDNDNLSAENRVLREDIKRLLKTCRDLANANLNYQDSVRYLEGINTRLVERVHRLEAAILDCDDPCHDARRVRRRLDYDSDTTVFEVFESTTEVIDLTTDEVLTP